ncbi:YbdD/YjiX family protein [Sphingomonas sp. PL-96]|uniref:YbdD/YjiX family protein n=1 Tax=Sphingomonas sp. PL-96 TaxID=2887201 RepID=UPI001E37B1D7|nr:CstA-like transporter-associated (seleno)protein [Sphingomonas sp. PL-96]MCC2975511.1 YbdD/YjiX family protein [Sphingomonas sp. PL-96]
MSRLAVFAARVRETAHLMVGMPSYAAYCEHMRQHHPDHRQMTEAEFFRERQQARYGGKNGGRCC